jgi:hypothetical protein
MDERGGDCCGIMSMSAGSGVDSTGAANGVRELLVATVHSLWSLLRCLKARSSVAESSGVKVSNLLRHLDWAVL